MTTPVSEDDQLPVSPVCRQPTVDDQPADAPPPVSEDDQLPVSPVCHQPTVDDQPADALPQLPLSQSQSASAMSTEAYVLNIQQQPDGTCIISLPDDFTGEAIVNIHPSSSELVSHTLNVDVTRLASDDDDATHSAVVEEDSSDQNSNDVEENVDLLSPPSASRKRQRRRQTWQKNVRKMKRTKGEEYVSDTTHKRVKERCVKPIDCSKCRQKCSSKVTEEQRQALFAEFYGLTSWEAQTAYIVQSIMEFEPARRATKTMQSGSVPRKSQSRAYYLTVSDGSSSRSVKVCKEMFLKTFDLNTARVHYALSKKKASHGLVDERGTKVNAMKTPAAFTDAVKDHIAKFPKYISHYSRSRSSKEFVRGVSSISEMYRLYADECKASSMTEVSEWVYRRIFNCNFNLSFHMPKSDTCKKCDTYAIQQKLGDVDDLAIRQEWDSHLASAEKTRAKLNDDKRLAKEGLKLTFAFDLQKTKPLPYLNTNEAYYKRQLSVYNCGIHDCGASRGYFHMWHEATASRGPAEIASCLWHWLQSIHTERSIPTDWAAYSDSCGGQNRNIVIAAFWAHVVQEMEVQCIDHVFMVSGHSFLPCDEDFGVDEKEKRKNETIFTLGEWIDVAKRARKKGEKFDVTEMPRTAFLDFKVLAKRLVNRKMNTLGEKVEWLKIRWMRFRKDSPYKMLYKYTVDDADELFKEVNFEKQRKGRQQQMPILQLPMLYPSGRLISQAKYKDIQDLMKYVPPIHHDFYNSIQHEQRKCSGPEVADDVHDNDSDATSDVDA